MEELRELYQLLDKARHIGRNQLCWCGSGEKYKRCHLGRDRAPEPTTQEILDQQRRVLERKVCLHADAGPTTCSKVIQAHTLQRSELSKIARSGKVYGFKGDFVTRMKTDGKLDIGLIGIRDASTFFGFCQNHDSTTFAPLETRPFKSSSEQVFLLAYRVICHELYAKEGQLLLLPFNRTLDRGKSLEAQVEIQHQLGTYQQGVQLGVNDLKSYKSEYDLALRNADFGDMHYYVVRFAEPPDLVCAGGVLPEYDFAGRFLQPLITPSNGRPDHITFSLVPTLNGGAAVFSWLGDSKAGEGLVRSLHQLPDDALPDALIRFALEWFENVFIRPDWWDQLEDSVQARLMRRMESGAISFDGHAPDALVDDGLRNVAWTVVSRDTNLVV